MISLEDCVALSGLTEEEILAIAEHEHLPEIAAAALAQYLSKQEHGMEKIRDMIVDDIRQAQQRQDKPHILTLLHVLHHFLKSHPVVCPPLHPWSELDFRSGRR
jgi:predicted small metal-binding protein